MFNPLASDPTKLTDTELTDKITKLLERMNFFSRTGHSDSFRQANDLYQALCMEQRDRIVRNYIKDEDQFSDLIDIQKKP